MKITPETLTVLKNFATINPNIEIQSGSKLETIAEAQNIYAQAEVTDEFPITFGIYDLHEFISVINLVGQDADLDFKPSHVEITGTNGTSANYYYASSNVLTVPTKEVVMPPSDVEITLTHDVLSQIRKAAATLGHNTMSIVSDGDRISVCAVDEHSDPSMNTFSIVLPEKGNGSCYDFRFAIGALKILPGDYEVSISAKRISHWVSSNVNYYIALEKTSTHVPA